MRTFTCSAAVAVAMFGITAAGSAAPAGGPEPFASAGEVSICVDIAFPPLEYYPRPGSKTPTGADVDLARAVGALWKLKVTFVNTGFSGLLPALASEKCGLVWSGIFVTAERTKEFPAVGYMRTHRALLVRAGNPERIRRPADLSGKTVATQSGTEYEKSLKAYDKQLRAEGKDGFDLQTYPKATDATSALLVGRVDVVLTQDTEAAYRITTNKKKFQIAYLYPEFDTFGVYYRKGDTAVGPALKAALRTLKRKGTIAKIARKHNLPAGNFVVS